MVTPPVPLGPLDTPSSLHALERVEAHLLDLLADLTDDEWNAPTIVPGWRVRHVAGHLLDTATRKLSAVRDGVTFERPQSGAPADVRAFVDRLNAEGVRVYGRLSPQVLAAMMAPASQALCAFQRALDPMAPARFPVSWAGETHSANWFDTARELTERWHHQAQVRLALGRPALYAREFYHPVLDCFMRVLPFAFREVGAATGSHLSVCVDGEAGGEWQLYRAADGWRLVSGMSGTPLARITIPAAIAWRVLTKGIACDEAERASSIEGDAALASHVLTAVAIVG